MQGNAWYEYMFQYKACNYAELIKQESTEKARFSEEKENCYKKVTEKSYSYFLD